MSSDMLMAVAEYHECEMVKIAMCFEGRCRR